MKKAVFFLICLSVLISSNLFAQWSQIGYTINGEESDESTGTSICVSADSMVVAYGAIGNSGLAPTAEGGHVRVMKYDGPYWIQLGDDIDGEYDNGSMGRAVDISADGTILAVGAPGNDSFAPGAGMVRILEYDGNSWVPKGSDIYGEGQGSISGSSLSLNAAGDIVAIGSPWNASGITLAGKIRVFQFSGGDWTKIGDIPGTAYGERIGWSVSLNGNGNVLAAGSTYIDEAGNDAGQVRIYENVSGNWILKGNPINGDTAKAYFGASICLDYSGNTIAVGATGDYNSGLNGHAKIYYYNNGVWIQKGNTMFADLLGDGFGGSISINRNGDLFAVGASGNNFSGTGAGQVKVYNYTNGDWSQFGQSLYGSSGGDYFGRSVGLNATGSILAVGIPGNDRVKVYGNTSSIHDLEINSNIRIYPNPATDKAFICGEIINGVEIMDMNGRTLISSNVQKNKYEIDLNKYDQGIYFVKVLTENGIVVRKIVVN